MARRQLGRWLRQLRDAARKTDADVEEANLASRAKLWRIETGKVRTKPGDVRGLCWLYGTDTETTDALAILAGATNQQGYWEDHDRLPAHLRLYRGMEPIADELRSYEPDHVPELLQTPDYARGILTAIDPDTAEESLTLLAARQEIIFSRTPPPRLTVILGTGALTRPVGDAEVMAGQVAWLHELNRRDCIDIRALPWEVGPHPAIRGGAFTILDFHHKDDPAVGYIETMTGARYAEKADEVNELRRAFRELYENTVPIEVGANLRRRQRHT